VCAALLGIIFDGALIEDGRGAQALYYFKNNNNH
jgi:hypothetical protein